MSDSRRFNITQEMQARWGDVLRRFLEKGWSVKPLRIKRPRRR